MNKEFQAMEASDPSANASIQEISQPSWQRLLQGSLAGMAALAGYAAPSGRRRAAGH